MKLCKVEGCTNKHCAKGLCSKHYRQYKKYGRILDRTIFDKNEIIEYEDYAEIIIRNKHHEEIARTIIDLEDMDKVKSIKWSIDKEGYIRNTKVGLLHRFLIDAPNGKVVDHTNHNKLDNRKVNLRVCTQQQNIRNMNKQRRDTSSIYKGVSYHKQKNKWSVQIYINNKIKYIGCYESEEEAGRAYDREAIKHYKQFVCTNFPIEDYADYIFELGYDIDDFIR